MQSPQSPPFYRSVIAEFEKVHLRGGGGYFRNAPDLCCASKELSAFPCAFKELNSFWGEILTPVAGDSSGKGLGLTG